MSFIENNQQDFPAGLLENPSADLTPVIADLAKQFLDGLEIDNLSRLVTAAESKSRTIWAQNTLPFNEESFSTRDATLTFLSRIYDKTNILSEFREDLSELMSSLNMAHVLIDRTIRQTTSNILVHRAAMIRFKHLSERQRFAEAALVNLDGAFRLLETLRRNLSQLLTLTLSRHDRLLRQEASLRLALNFKDADWSGNARQSKFDTNMPNFGDEDDGLVTTS